MANRKLNLENFWDESLEGMFYVLETCPKEEILDKLANLMRDYVEDKNLYDDGKIIKSSLLEKEKALYEIGLNRAKELELNDLIFHNKLEYLSGENKATKQNFEKLAPISDINWENNISFN